VVAVKYLFPWHVTGHTTLGRWLTVFIMNGVHLAFYTAIVCAVVLGALKMAS
jgi:hypothetical protein